MGRILHIFKNPDKPRLHISRRVDKIEKQELNMNFFDGSRSWLSTATGDQLRLFCDDENGNTMEVDIPISVQKLKEALENYISKS